jgi:hypothetical protein
MGVPAETPPPESCARCGELRLTCERRTSGAVKGVGGGFTLGGRPDVYYWVTCDACGFQYWYPDGARP